MGKYTVIGQKEIEPRIDRIALKNGNIMATSVVKMTKMVRMRSLVGEKWKDLFLMNESLMV